VIDAELIGVVPRTADTLQATSTAGPGVADVPEEQSTVIVGVGAAVTVIVVVAAAVVCVPLVAVAVAILLPVVD